MLSDILFPAYPYRIRMYKHFGFVMLRCVKLYVWPEGKGKRIVAPPREVNFVSLHWSF
jgi:hypothetical protein